MSKLRISVPYKVIAVFGPNPCGDNGREEVRYYCPECINRKGTPDTKGKLYVNVKTLKYNCFRCGYSGRIGRVRVSSDRVYQEDQDVEVEEIVHDINSVYSEGSGFDLKIPVDKIFTSDKAVKYLLDRGFTERQMEYYDMRAGNLNQEFGRIVIPNQVDHLVYTDFYSARTFIDQIPKYHNPGKEKSKIVFNLHRQQEGSPIIVVEGALTAVAAGYHAVATLGKTMTRDQASKIIRKKPSIIYVNYDYGAEKYSRAACSLLRSLNSEVPIYEILMKDERDAADLTHAEYTECIRNAIKYEPLLDDISSLINS